ncbi:MAG: CpsD/CapB family tyrosine-protein kinase [Terriglobales bacterium]
MSRIHDALKRAEEERAAAMGTHVENSLQPLDPQAVEMPNLQGGNAPAMGPVSGFSFEALLARCPQTEWKPDPNHMLFFQDDETRVGTEEFRTLRSRLYQIREKMPLKRILVTSAMPREGKSFVAANMGQVLVRQHGRRALVIDGDLRNPGQHSNFGVPLTPGLSDYLAGECDEFAIMRRGQMDNLFFIPAGRVMPSAPELLANGRLKLLLQRFEPLFDWIIVDSSPVIPVSDPTVVAGYCDGVLMVVRSEVTSSDLAKRAREEFPENLLLGVVLNGTMGRHAQARYYYGASMSPYVSPYLTPYRK